MGHKQEGRPKSTNLVLRKNHLTTNEVVALGELESKLPDLLVEKNSAVAVG